MVTIRSARVLALGVTVGLTLVTAAPALAAPANPGGINGSAFGLSVQAAGILNIGPTPQVVLPPDGTRREVSTVNVPASPLVTANVLAVATQGDPTAGTSTATATVAMAEVLPNLIPGQPSVLSADAVNAQCTSTTAGQTGSSSLTNLRANGQPLANATPGANTVVQVQGLARVVLNEQITNPDGSLTVNGVHVTLLPAVIGQPGAEIILASVTCGPNAIAVPISAVPTAGLPIAGGLVAAFLLGVVVLRRRQNGTVAA
ncbi:MAG: choice-of-anchor P family protein [Mycobacteriales bacterium]